MFRLMATLAVVIAMLDGPVVAVLTKAGDHLVPVKAMSFYLSFSLSAFSHAERDSERRYIIDERG